MRIRKRKTTEEKRINRIKSLYKDLLKNGCGEILEGDYLWLRINHIKKGLEKHCKLIVKGVRMTGDIVVLNDSGRPVTHLYRASNQDQDLNSIHLIHTPMKG